MTQDTLGDPMGTLSGEARIGRCRCMLFPSKTTEAQMTFLTAIAIAFSSLALAAGAATLLARRRRRPGRYSPIDPLPAGMKHLAAHVGSLSDLGHGLAVRPGQRWRRLGTLLGVR